MLDWKALEKSGFLLIKGGFNSEEVKILADAYETSPNSLSKSYPMKILQSDVLEKFRAIIDERFVKNISAQTIIKSDRISSGVYFGIKAGVDLSWHIDHDSFYFYKDHINHLNIYCPVIKPVKNKSNLCVIPLDRFQELMPTAYKMCYGRGAIRVLRNSKKTLFVDDNDGRVLEEPFDIESIAYTPQLEAGDVFIMRGDVIHRTEDTETDRVALSFRIIYSNGIVKKSNYDNPCLRKAAHLARNAQHKIKLQCFDLAKKQELTIGECNSLFEKNMSDPSFRNIAPINMIEEIAEPLKQAQASKVVVIEDLQDASTAQLLLTMGSSLGLSVLFARESAKSDEAGKILSAVKTNVLDDVLFVGVQNLDELYQCLKNAKFKIVGIEPFASTSVESHEKGDKVAFVINASGKELSPQSKKYCDELNFVSVAPGRVQPHGVLSAVTIALHTA